MELSLISPVFIENLTHICKTLQTNDTIATFRLLENHHKNIKQKILHDRNPDKTKATRLTISYSNGKSNFMMPTIYLCSPLEYKDAENHLRANEDHGGVGAWNTDDIQKRIEALIERHKEKIRLKGLEEKPADYITHRSLVGGILDTLKERKIIKHYIPVQNKEEWKRMDFTITTEREVIALKVKVKGYDQKNAFEIIGGDIPEIYVHNKMTEKEIEAKIIALVACYENGYVIKIA